MDKYTYFWVMARSRFSPLDICSDMYNYKDICQMKKTDLVSKIKMTDSEAEYYIKRFSEIDIDKEYEDFLKSGVNVLEYGKEGYPARLLNIQNPPRALFYYGELPDESEKAVAIIGARKCSEYGRVMAERISTGLAEQGVTIISGMAIGIDGISQMCALNAGGKSFGILGSGVDICYPRANRQLYERLKKEGGLISEYPNGTGAVSANFPMRNRIISGLCDGLIIIEAKIKSGTMITVDDALNQGREIMAVPGRATDPMSVGCNALIYQGAHPVQCAEDVIEVLGTIPIEHYLSSESNTEISVNKIVRRESKTESIIDTLKEAEKNIYDILDYYPMSVEEIANRLDMEFYDAMALLLSLEMKDVIKEAGKSYYVRKI